MHKTGAYAAICWILSMSPAQSEFVFGDCTSGVPRLKDAEKLVCECSLVDSSVEQLDCYDDSKSAALMQSRERCETYSLSKMTDYYCTKEGEVSRLLFECGGNDPLERLSCYKKVGNPSVLFPAFFLRLARELALSRDGRQGMSRALREHEN
jgi:hypothetical protein